VGGGYFPAVREIEGGRVAGSCEASVVLLQRGWREEGKVGRVGGGGKKVRLLQSYKYTDS
jgi:hypothetical protein